MPKTSPEIKAKGISANMFVWSKPKAMEYLHTLAFTRASVTVPDKC